MKKDIFKRFSSIRELNNTLEAGTIQPAFVDKDYSRINGFSFCGTEDYDEAKKLMLCGDKNLQKQIEEGGVSDARIKIRKTAARRQLYTSVVGALPNVPAFIAGTPNSMICQRTIKTRKKVLSIGYGIVASGDTNKKDIISASVKVISALMQIEATGVRCNIYSLFCAKKNNTKLGFTLKIKDAGQKFDTLRMAYPFAHSSYLRRQCFRWEEITEGVPSNFVTSYGQVPSSEEQKEFFTKNGQKFDCVLSFNDVQYMSTEDIIKKIVSA